MLNANNFVKLKEKALEENPELNCGIGSNLNRNGYVECEASYMLSKYMSYGAVACVCFYSNILGNKADNRTVPLFYPPL